MSRLEEWIAWMLNQIFPRLPMHQKLQTAKSNIEANQRWAYQEAERVCPNFGPHWDLDGKRTLNVGAGLGGKLPFYVEAGAHPLVGIDLDVRSTRIAQRYITSLGLTHGAKDTVVLVVSDAASLPFCDDSFDAVVSINVFEHIERVEEALRECHRILRPGGLAFLHLPPYYSPWGPHLESWIHFPWAHLLFSEKTLMRVAARKDAQLRLSRQFVEAARIHWACDDGQVPGVNHVTLRQFRRMVSEAGLSIVQLRLLPVGYEFLRSGSALKRLSLSLLKMMARIPLLQEVVVTKMVYVLQKVVQG